MKDFYIEGDANKRDSGFYPQSDVIYNVVLGISTMETITVPDDVDIVEFKATGDFWCRFDADVAVPVADIVDGSAGELNPDKRVVRGVTNIRLISAAAVSISMAFFNIPRAVPVG